MRRKPRATFLLAFVLALVLVTSTTRARADEPPRWYDRLSLRGYTQLRYNGVLATNPRLQNPQGDKSLGAPGGFFVRRARLVLSADLDRVGLYLQPDFASAVDKGLHFSQVRDWWADVFLTKEKTFRLRVGQQKVPYGWELMQSSSNRLPFDRSDALNSAFLNERDLGLFFMFETEAVRRRFRRLLDAGLKGSGDYGMVATGVANGQPMGTREQNTNKHFFARVAYPFDVGSQTMEVAGGGYTGRYVVSRDEGIGGPKEVRDLRVHGTFVLYPKPFGLQAEYNAGVGPERVGAKVEERPLHGGYLMAMYRIAVPEGHLTPYARVHHYDGGKKFETNAPRHEVRELNVGVEWQFMRWLELTAEVMASERTVDAETESGRVLRFQAQFDY